MTLSISTPITKEIATAPRKATQKFSPHCINCQLMYVLNMAISPWAKLRWSVDT